MVDPIHDHLWSIIYSKYQQKEQFAKAIEFGLQFAKDMLIQEFILDGDLSILINALKEISPPPSSIVAIVYGSLSASHDFCQVEFSHVRWQANRLVHLLAKYALCIDDFFVVGPKYFFSSLIFSKK